LRDFSLPAPSEKTKELARLGKAVRELREERRLSRGELAAAVGVGHSRIQALEAGRLDPDYVLLVRLAKALGVRAGALVLRAEESASEERPAPHPPAESPS
jgi:transcriptional regulator with XRE-family HTH domain